MRNEVSVILECSSEAISQASTVISSGGVIGFRTDTFYGLGVDPFNAAAVQKLKKLKGREDKKPILVVISDRERVGQFIRERSAEFDRLSERFWPGPLTLIGAARSEVPVEITAGSGTIGLRLPADDDVRELLRACGGALTATSANPSDQPPSQTAQQVANYFVNGIDLVVDGGSAQTDQPSTVIDVTGLEPKLIREGVIEWQAIVQATDGTDLHR